MTTPSPEDFAAAAVHVAGLLAALALAPGLAAASPPGERRASVVAFSAAWAALYVASVAFHASPDGPARHLFGAADNAAIFLVVAAGYAPLGPFRLPPPAARRLALAVWVPAALGLAVEGAAVATGDRAVFQEAAWALYLTQAALPLVLCGRALLRALSRASLGTLAAANAAYLVGLWFYLRPEPAWHHVAWHAAVVAGCLTNHGGVRRLTREAAGRA